MIEIQAVTKRFGAFTAVDNVSLRIEAGEFITLLGPSGCGKTTLLRMLSGLETPDDGVILLGGEDVTFLPPYRRNVNQVFQGYALFPHLSVRDNIGFGLRMQKVPTAEATRRIDEVIALVALQGFEERKPSQLSGGQRQRVALARAIVLRPSVLLLDEPLSALDAKLRGQMQLELKRLQKHLGLTFVFVTHDQEEALTMSDRIAVMNTGRIEQLGTPAEIYHHPRTAFVADFIGEANLLPAERVDASAQTVRVKIKGGLTLELPAAKWPEGAAPVLISIRPEKIHLSRQPVFGDNVFAACVTEEIFHGTFDRLAIECSDTQTCLTVVVANESAIREAFHAGDRVWCALHADDVVVIAGSDKP